MYTLEKAGISQSLEQLVTDLDQEPIAETSVPTMRFDQQPSDCGCKV